MDLTPAQAHFPSWRFSPQWLPLPGMAYGLRQPGMLGCWDCETSAPWDRASLDLAMATCLQLDDTAVTEHDEDDGDRALLRRLLYWTGAVQRRNKLPVFDDARIWNDPDPRHPRRLQIAMPHAGAEASLIALRWIEQAVQRQLRGQPVPADDCEALSRALQPFQVQGFNSIHFLQAAHDLGLPWQSVVSGVFAFGQGVACRWLESSYTDRTSVLGTRLARDKMRTAQLLRQLGMPAPTHARATSAQHAVQLARQIGYPVVVKPVDRDQGQGVSADVRDDAAVLAAHAVAAEHSARILVEKHVDGNDYRLTILNGRMIKAIVRRAAGVLGDGRSSIAELVEHLRNDPHYLRLSHARGHAPLALDHEAHDLLAQLGLTAQSVPAQGQFTPLRRRANVSAGGTPILIQGPIHPDNQRLAERAAQALQLDLAGVDLILPDIARSWLQTGGLITEVNGQPQLGTSTTPTIYQQVLRSLLPVACRIPVVLVIDTDDAVARQLHAQVANRMPPWGLACSDGVWEGAEQVAPDQGNRFQTTRVLAASRVIAGAILVMTPAQVMLNGLPFDRVHVLVVAGSAAAQDWNAVALDAMWRMVLPHVDGSIVCMQQWADSAAASAPSHGPDPRWQMVPDDAAAVLHAVIPHLAASPMLQAAAGHNGQP